MKKKNISTTIYNLKITNCIFQTFITINCPKLKSLIFQIQKNLDLNSNNFILFKWLISKVKETMNSALKRFVYIASDCLFVFAFSCYEDYGQMKYVNAK